MCYEFLAAIASEVTRLSVEQPWDVWLRYRDATDIAVPLYGNVQSFHVLRISASPVDESDEFYDLGQHAEVPVGAHTFPFCGRHFGVQASSFVLGGTAPNADQAIGFEGHGICQAFVSDRALWDCRSFFGGWPAATECFAVSGGMAFLREEENHCLFVRNVTTFGFFFP